MLNLKYKIIVIINLVYCYIPVFLFLLGWCKFTISIPSCILLAYLFYKFIKSNNGDHKSLKIHPVILIIVLFVSLLLALTLGYGGIFATFQDYVKHSAILQDLVTYNWPVVYVDAQDPSILTYYLGSYLFPALIGKIFSNRIVAEISLGFVGWIGMLLLFLNIIFITNANSSKKQILALTIYLLFSGLLFPLQYVMSFVNSDVSVGNPHWFGILQYRSTIVSLRWVWQQYYVPIIGLIMICNYKQNRNYYALWMLPSLICGTWGFITLLFFVILEYIIDSLRKHQLNSDIFSWQNISCAVIGSFIVVYLLGSLLTDKPEELKFHVVDNLKYYIFSYLPFCIFMFGIYFALIWKDIHKDIYFFITLCVLLIIPLFKAGLYNDWVMCTSMPALFLLSIYCVKFLYTSNNNTKIKIKKTALVLLLLLNIPYTIKELKMTYTGMPERSLKQYSCIDCEDVELDYKSNYFTYNYKESLFYKYIMRK